MHNSGTVGDRPLLAGQAQWGTCSGLELKIRMNHLPEWPRVIDVDSILSNANKQSIRCMGFHGLQVLLLVDEIVARNHSTMIEARRARGHPFSEKSRNQPQ